MTRFRDLVRWTGYAWIILTALYFHVHFILAFFVANRASIQALWK